MFVICSMDQSADEFYLKTNISVGGHIVKRTSISKILCCLCETLFCNYMIFLKWKLTIRPWTCYFVSMRVWVSVCLVCPFLLLETNGWINNISEKKWMFFCPSFFLLLLLIGYFPSYLLHLLCVFVLIQDYVTHQYCFYHQYYHETRERERERERI